MRLRSFVLLAVALTAAALCHPVQARNRKGGHHKGMKGHHTKKRPPPQPMTNKPSPNTNNAPDLPIPPKVTNKPPGRRPYPPPPPKTMRRPPGTPNKPPGAPKPKGNPPPRPKGKGTPPPPAPKKEGTRPPAPRGKGTPPAPPKNKGKPGKNPPKKPPPTAPSIRTVSSPPPNKKFKPDIVVPDDYKKIQDAIDASKDGAKKPSDGTLIYIKAGTYKEQLWILKSKKYLTIVGDGADRTKITSDHYAGMKADADLIETYARETEDEDRWGGMYSQFYEANGGDRMSAFSADELQSAQENIGTSGAGSVHVFGEGFVAAGITFENTIDPRTCDCEFAMAPAIHVHPGAKSKIGIAFYDCSFLGNQDTVYLHSGYVYMKNVYIKGYIDVIFGPSKAYIEDAVIEINTKKNAPVGVTAQSRKSADHDSGFSFNRGTLKGDGGKIYLGRMWGAFSTVIFSNYYIEDIIKPEGWFDWGRDGKNAFYAEYGNDGPGAMTNKRVDWAELLSPDEVQEQKYLSKAYCNAEDWLQDPPPRP